LAKNAYKNTFPSLSNRNRGGGRLSLISLLCTAATCATAQTPEPVAGALPAVTVQGVGPETVPAYAGGQVTTESRVGILGQKHFMETPFAVTGYTEENMRNSQAQDMGAVLRADPAVYVPSKRNLYETFFVRGFSANVDDMQWAGLPGMAPRNRAATEMADRVEIIKGPSAFLGGMPPSGNIGANIHMVPKRAGNAPLTRLNTSYESDSLWGVHVDAGRRFGEQQQWGLRVNGAYRDGDTAVNRQEHETGLVALALDWRGGDNDRARVSLDVYNVDEDMRGVDFVGISSLAPAVTQVPRARRGDYALAPDWAFNRQNSHATVLRGEWDINADTTAWVAWGRKHSYYSALINFSTLMDDAGNIGVRAVRQLSGGTDNAFDTGLRGSMRTGSIGHEWTAAFTRHQWDSYGRRGQYPLNAQIVEGEGVHFSTAPDLSNYDPSRRNLQWSSGNVLRSLVLADTLSFADGLWQLTVGARYQQVKTEGMSVAANYAVTQYDESRVSPSLALLYKANPMLSFYGNYIEGLSQGGLAPVGSVNAGEVLKPYKSKQGEIGAKIDLGRMALTASVFQITKPSAQTDPETLIYAVYGERRNRGLEMQWFGEVQSGLRLLGGMSYTQAQWSKTFAAQQQGKQVTGVPRLMLKMGAEYDLPQLPGLSLTGYINHTGKRAVTDDNRLQLKAYSTLDLGARYRFGPKLTVRANVQNVTNKAYWYGSGSGNHGSGLSGGLGAPRTVLLSATIDF